jgi:hypothetical protein
VQQHERSSDVRRAIQAPIQADLSGKV